MAFAAAIVRMNEQNDFRYDLDTSKAAAVATKPAPPVAKPRRNAMEKFSSAEVAKHNTEEDMYLVIDNEVYDVTTFAPTHPGGTIIYKYMGKDASDQFAAFHRPKVRSYLRRYKIGSLREEDHPVVSPATADYRKLREMLWSDKFFRPDHKFYAIKHAVFLALIAGAALVAGSGSRFGFYTKTIVGGCLLGIGLQQVSGPRKLNYGASAKSTRWCCCCRCCRCCRCFRCSSAAEAGKRQGCKGRERED